MYEADSVIRAIIYARLSRDRDGTQTATARQTADCRKYAEAKGWSVVAVQEDADLSAYSLKVRRPGFEAVKEAVVAGEADVVLAWKLDRLLRRPRDFEDLWQLCQVAGAHIATVSDGIDTSTPMAGVLVPRILSTFAEMEGENISIRERRKHEETAKAGRRSGGGSRPFGLTRDWSAAVPAEADAIRAAVDSILAGGTIYHVAAEWNTRGLKTPTGGAWNVQKVRSMLRSPRIAGLREHRGDIVGPAEWPAIVTPEKHERLRAIFSARRAPAREGRYLLTGMLRCGKCGNRLFVRRRSKDRVRRYGCEKAANNGSCGGVHVVAEPLEAHVRDVVLDYLDSPALAAALDAHERKAETLDLDALRADEAALEELSRDYYTERIVSRAEYLSARDELERRIKAARVKLARTNGTGPLRALLGADLRDAWEHEELLWRREVLGAVVDRIIIGPAVPGRNAFDPVRASIEWRY
ncbi:MAG: recombinase family protein [Candidatus Limnocylindria bacterium]